MSAEESAVRDDTTYGAWVATQLAVSTPPRVRRELARREYLRSLRRSIGRCWDCDLGQHHVCAMHRLGKFCCCGR